MKKDKYHHGNLREELIDIAVQAIESGGTGAVNLRDISLKAGVSRAAPYRHFKNKAHLMTAVAARGFEMLERACSGTNPGKPADRLMELGSRYLAFALENPELYSVMFDPEVFTPPVHPDLRSASDQAFTTLETVLQEFQGEIQTEFNAGAVWAMVHGLAIILNQKLIQVIAHERPDSGEVTGDKADLIQHALAVLAAGIARTAEK